MGNVSRKMRSKPGTSAGASMVRRKGRRWRSGIWGLGTGAPWPLACALLAVSLAGSSCSSKDEGDAAPTVTVQVSTAEKTSIQHKLSADAVLYPLDQATIVPKISAPIVKYYVHRGSHVH